MRSVFLWLGFSLALYLLYGWGYRKERLVESVPLNRGKNQSVLGAFARNGMVATTGKIGAMKRVDVERFLEFDLLPKLPVGSVLVLDNARIHKGEGLKKSRQTRVARFCIYRLIRRTFLLLNWLGDGLNNQYAG